MGSKHKQRGQGMTEYVILVAVIAMAGLALVTGFGDGIGAWFGEATGTITGLPTS